MPECDADITVEVKIVILIVIFNTIFPFLNPLTKVNRNET